MKNLLEKANIPQTVKKGFERPGKTPQRTRDP
jgi:hypothetical protein